MKKYFLLSLLVLSLLLVGCTATTPWGNFSVTPDAAPSGQGNSAGTGQDTGAGNASGQGTGASGGSGASAEASTSSDSVDNRNILYFDPEGNTFTVEIDGIPNANFDQVGAVVETGEIPSASSYQDLFVGNYPDTSPRNVVIKSRVKLGARNLEVWRAQVMSGNLQRKNFRIVITNEDNLEVARISYVNAWPSDYRLEVTQDGFEEVVTLTAETVAVESS